MDRVLGLFRPRRSRPKASRILSLKLELEIEVARVLPTVPKKSVLDREEAFTEVALTEDDAANDTGGTQLSFRPGLPARFARLRLLNSADTASGSRHCCN